MCHIRIVCINTRFNECTVIKNPANIYSDLGFMLLVSSKVVVTSVQIVLLSK